MHKKIIPFSLFVISIIVGFLIFGHFNSPQFARSDDELGKLRDQEKAVDILIDEQSVLKEQILTLREEIDTLSANRSYTADQEKLEELKTRLGLTEMTGRGVALQIETTLPELNPSDIVTYSADLRDIVQRLWSGDARAISINGQRVTALTPITPVGNSILVNDTRIFPPFEIIALEGESVLAQELNFGLYLPEIQNRLESGEYELEMTNSDKLTVPVFTGRMPTDHLTLHEND
jgi:uncharacterized protein YlxW (UPF0749 family)